jgi:hypothetical protein
LPQALGHANRDRAAASHLLRVANPSLSN